ncbi:MAG: hypothetical protein ACRC33_17825 [Gemmataceae bacterium]
MDTRWVIGAGVAALLAGGLARAWWVEGHGSVAEAAVAGLPDDVPRFFRASAKALYHLAGEPDRWKNREAKHLRAAEAPDHFIDLEDFQGRPLPADRWKAIKLLQELKANPEFVGFLPYAIMENYDRLTVAFSDHRKDPENATVQHKCVIYAGILSHLTGDCVMPLHTTRDYDGRKAADGKVTQKGIHAKLDAFPEKHGLKAEEMARGLKARKLDDVWKHVLERIDESHKLIGRCYELDAEGAFEKPTKESRAFVLERCQAGAQFTTDLWYAAWLRSEKLPPHW